MKVGTRRLSSSYLHSQKAHISHFLLQSVLPKKTYRISGWHLNLKPIPTKQPKLSTASTLISKLRPTWSYFTLNARLFWHYLASLGKPFRPYLPILRRRQWNFRTAYTAAVSCTTLSSNSSTKPKHFSTLNCTELEGPLTEKRNLLRV